MKNFKKGAICFMLIIVLGIIQTPIFKAITLLTYDNTGQTTQQSEENVSEQDMEQTSAGDSAQESEHANEPADTLQASEQEQFLKQDLQYSHLEDYTDMYGWERTEGLKPLFSEQQQLSMFSANAFPSLLRRYASEIKTAQYLMILIEFSDMTDVRLDDSYTLQAVDMVLNSGGINVVDNEEIDILSLKDYLKHYSYGTYQVQGSVFRKNNLGKTVSHVASHPYGYYQAKTDSNPIGYDLNIKDSSNPESSKYRERELMEEAVAASTDAIEQLFSGDQLDINGDGFIDAITFVVESRGNEINTTEVNWGSLLWPHKVNSTLTNTIAGKKIGAYNLINAFDPRQQKTVFANNGKTIANANQQLKLNWAYYSAIHHEFLHTLGLHDLYRNSQRGEPVGFYDIMSDNNPFSPQGILRIFSSNVLGWSKELPEIESNGTITIHRPKYENRDEVTAYKIISPMHHHEYFVVEFYEKQKHPYLGQNGREDGFIVYRINSALDFWKSNSYDSGNGELDYLFVFRHGETVLGAGNGSLNDAVISPTVGTTFGKTLSDVGYNAGWDANTLYYSDGKNSGIKIQVVASTDDSITLEVSGPATDIQVSPPSITLKEGFSHTMDVNVCPAQSSDTITYQLWNSLDPDVVTVEPQIGKITAVQAGTAQVLVTVAVSSSRVFSKTIDVTVIPATHSAVCQGHTQTMINGVPACTNNEGSLHICRNNFSDETFYKYISQLNKESKYFTSEQLSNIDTIYVSGQTINSMQGVEYFSHLTNLSCSDNNLIELDVSHNTALTELTCLKNNLTSLDVSHNTALTYLSCSDNNLTSLDVSHNTALTDLICMNNNLTELDVSHNTVLTYLNCGNNNLSELNLSKNILLSLLYCNNMMLEELDLSHNAILQNLNCNNNILTQLDLSHNTALNNLECRSNPMTTLNISKCTALKGLDCSFCYLEELDVSYNQDLSKLHCRSNNLMSLDLTSQSRLNDIVIHSQGRTLPIVYQNGNWEINLSQYMPKERTGHITVEPNSKYTYNPDTTILRFHDPNKLPYVKYTYYIESKDISFNCHLQPITSATGTLGNNADFNGETVSLLNALYTFTSNGNGSYTVSAETAGGETVYLGLHVGKSGFPNNTSNGGSITLEQNTDTTINIKSTAQDYIGYLYFWHDGQNCFAQTTRVADQCEFQLYRLATDGETYSQKVPGYVRVTGTKDVINNGKYLIVAEVDGSCYALYPSGSPNNKYSHVIKINSENLVESGTGKLGSDSSFNGETVSLRNALYTFVNNGYDVYSVSAKTTSGETVYLCLQPDKIGYPQTTNENSAITLLQNFDNSVNLNSSTNDYTGYLYFWDEDKLHFDQQAVTSSNTKFLLYRPASRSETDSSEIPGYVWETNPYGIVNGGQYLIVAKVDNNYYALYPSNSTDNKYSHVIKINSTGHYDYEIPLAKEGTGHLGTDASFSGKEVPLSCALYTFTNNHDGGYTVFGRTTGGEKVGLNLQPNKAGYPQVIDESGSITLEQSPDSSFYIKSIAANYTGYLYFWRDGKDYFDQQISANSSCKFLLYRRGIVSETTSAEVPGYVKVTHEQEIISGNQYLIVAQVEGDYYALYPFNSTNNKYTHVIKIDSQLMESGTGNLGTDASFSGEAVSLCKALYTFNINDTGEYTVFSETTGGETVGLKLQPNKAGYPQAIDESGSITLEQSPDSSFYIKSAAANYTGYLYFWRDGKDYFDQQISANSSCKFLLYRRGIVGETTSAEVSGYVKVTHEQEIINGNQYLIVAQVKDDYYALYPSNSTNNKYAHVIRINQKSTESGTGNLGTDASFSGEAVSMRNALYTFTSNNGGYTVSAQTSSGETVNLFLRAGNAGYPQTTDNAGIISVIENNDGSFYIKSTSYDYTGYLDFWHANDKLYFDQSTELENVYNKRFYLYRLAAPREESSAEIPGYVQITSANAITNGGKYLIVTEVDGCCYALYPSKITNNKYSHVIKAKPADLPSGTGNLGDDSSFTGQTVPLSSSLYTFTSNSSGYTVSAQTNSGQTVSLCLRSGNAGYPQTADRSGTITLTQNNDGTFYIKSSSREYTGYLYFWHDTSKLHFDQSMNLDSNPINSKFFLFRPAMEGERGSTEIPGYVWVNSAGAITNGGQYLIVTEVNNTYYALHPSNDTNNKYSHIIKIHPADLLPSGTGNLGTDNQFNGPKVSLKNALYDFTNNNNNCTVSSKTISGEKVNLGLRPGKAGYPQSTDYTGNVRLYASTQDSSFMINTFTEQYDGFLYFFRDSNKLYFGQTTQYDQNDVSQKFFLYRPATANEKSSTEIPGYVRVTSSNTIGSGKQYLITTEVHGNYYALYPSNAYNNPYYHVIKINSYQTHSFGNDLNNFGIDDWLTYISYLMYYAYVLQLNNGQ